MRLGHELAKRKCPYRRKEDKELYFLQELFYYDADFGGAGAFSDGKYNITNDFGGTLYEHIGKQPAIDLMEYVDEINMKYGGDGHKALFYSRHKAQKGLHAEQAQAFGCIGQTSRN